MNRYVTTTLPYVNGDPHIGFALEILQADALVRMWRLQGDDVFFSTGTDGHGQKIAEAAEKSGQSVQEYVDHYAAEFQKLKDALQLSNNKFIRTTNPEHYAAAQEMWRLCNEAGDIYEKTYTGLYCVGCEAFKTERELDLEQHCLLHPHLELVTLSEKNYFFAFSKYQTRLLEYLNRPDVIIPEWRREEAINFVQGGLEDFSISREKVRLTWGVPVPGDDTQVMYVWFDALTNYISTLGWSSKDDENFKKFWISGETYQFAGKDQVRFQSLMWQAMLMSADIKNTDHVFYHGFINSGGQKMSKSLGNVINPYELIAKYGIDATRYLLLRHVHPVDDSDVTWERLDEWYTANLVNGLGNLVARILKLSEDYVTEPVPFMDGNSSVDQEFIDRMNNFSFNEAFDYIFEMIAECDALITERAPFKKVKSEEASIREDGKADIVLLLQHLAKIAAHLAPVLPHTSEVIFTSIVQNKKPENMFPRLT
jgi:methionyl-tRNA synthetase